MRVSKQEQDSATGCSHDACKGPRSSALTLPGSPQQQQWRDVIEHGSATSSRPAQLKARASGPGTDAAAIDGRPGVALPTSLQRGIEALAGLSMDAVRVHYDSARPAQLGAHAYAQGTEIHLAPRQEQHLGHEAWHVVQQMQGRVRPNAHVHGVGLADSPALEAEADAMGRRALQVHASDHLTKAAPVVAPVGVPAPVQRVERQTSIYNRVPHTNDFNKNMEIIDSTSSSVYVHLSRDAAADNVAVNIQQQPNFFNGLQEANKRSRVDEADAANPHFDLAQYTLANNVHVTLEGRYAHVMSRLANGLDLRDAVKQGPPVVAGYANLNFGSYAGHGNHQASQRDIYGYINKWAEDAEEAVRNREQDYDGQKDELLGAIDEVQTETSDFAEHLIDNSVLNDLDDDDFVHYGGEEWDPVIPDDLE